MIYTIRIILMAIYFFVASLFFIVIALFNPFNPRLTALASRGIGKGIVWLMGIELIVENKDELEKLHPCVIVSNHQHNLDVAIFGSLMPYGAVTIGKKAIKKIPIFGQLYWLSGNILIDRKDKVRAIASMDRAINEIKNKNVSVWIMPEGTRSSGRGVLPFKKGAFHVALQANCPVRPVCVSSFDKSFNLKKIKSGTLKIRVLPPLMPGPYLEKNEVERFTKDAYHLVKKNVEELDATL